MRRPALAAVAALALLATSGRTEARPATWTDHYREALEALERGKLGAARRQLDLAIAQNPVPQAAARTYGARSVSYLPWLHLSVVAYRERDLDEAARLLARSRDHGVASTVEEGRTLLAKQELLIRNLRMLRAAGASDDPDLAPLRRSANDLERERYLARQVAGQCGVRPPERGGSRPWYFHYLLALELAEHGDAAGALGQIARALDRREEPRELARTYGMKVVNYRPWFEMGRAHARLGNWDCAERALDLSERLEDFVEHDELARRERQELLAGARQQGARSR